MRNNKKLILITLVLIIFVAILGYGIYIYIKQPKLEFTSLPALPSYEDRQKTLEEGCANQPDALWVVCLYNKMTAKVITWDNKTGFQPVNIADPIILRINSQNIINANLDKIKTLSGQIYLCLKTPELGAEKIIQPQPLIQTSEHGFRNVCFEKSNKNSVAEIILSGAIPASGIDEKFDFELIALKSISDITSMFLWDQLDKGISIFKDTFAHLKSINY